VTSHSAVRPTADALQAAIRTHRRQGLDAHLLAAVDRIAAVDPGAGGVPGIVDIRIPGVPPVARTPYTDTFLDDVGARLAVLIAAVVVGLPFLLWALARLLAWRSRRRADRDPGGSSATVRARS
jgi:hypothetical protein